jgi:hypothetical protein
VKEEKESEMTTKVVNVKSDFASKINWVAFITAVLSALAALGIMIPVEWQDLIIKIGAIGSPALIMVLRTWFTKSITISSAKRE